MLELPVAERLVLWTLLAVCGIAVWAGTHRISRGQPRYRRLVAVLVAMAAGLGTVILTLRAVAIGSVPLTGLFESVVLLCIVLAVAYLFLSITILEVWFGAVMVWMLLGTAVLAALLAEPASPGHPAAQTPWAVVHALAMVLGGAAMFLSAATALLYLLAGTRLKQRQLARVLGRVPTLGTLERLNLLGLQGAFVLIGLGVVSGFGIASARSAMLDLSPTDWLSDSKIVLTGVSWLLVGAVLLLRRLARLRGRAVAYATLVALFLNLFAMVGSRVFCASKHDFAGTGRSSVTPADGRPA